MKRTCASSWAVTKNHCMMQVNKTVSFEIDHGQFLPHHFQFRHTGGADKSLARRGRKRLQRQKILTFIYPIYSHNWRNISIVYIYIYITRLASNEIFSPSKKVHREVGRAKDVSAPLYSKWYLLYLYVGWLLASISILLTANQHKSMIDAS